MTSKIKVIVCSNSAIDYLDYDKNIDVFRSKINFGFESFDDYTELSASDFYSRLTKEPDNIPKTSYVSQGHMLKTFNNLYKEGYKQALVIVIAKPLSGLHDAIIQVSKETKLKVHVYDSKTLAYPESYMAMTAQNMVNLGSNIEEIKHVLNFIRDNHKMYFAVDTLLYLVKNGRLSKLSGTLGSFLKIKPVLTLTQEGKVETLEKIRTSKKAIARIVELYLEDTKDKDVITFISHAHNDEGVETIKKMIHEVYPDRQIISNYLTPVVGAHCGPKAISVGYILKQ
ncbi:DegV family protein [Acholeplasma granularum]|uniref:DegV family protein n=1 Tax=Acholeplasma granularum TaxID=264635 RepID=UPI00046F345F|nr:DegV family protein [Acholeplasma granularum]